MKTILWATLSANGNYARSSQRHPPKPEALADFAELTRTHRNFIVGRNTFEQFQAQPPPEGGNASMANTAIVVVSTTLSLPPGAPASSVRDPKAALSMLQELGVETAVVVGGERLHNAFLAAGLVDELCLLIAPGFEDQGLKLVLPPGQRRGTELLDSQSLGGGIVRLRYALGPSETW